MEGNRGTDSGQPYSSLRKVPYLALSFSKEGGKDLLTFDGRDTPNYLLSEEEKIHLHLPRRAILTQARVSSAKYLILLSDSLPSPTPALNLRFLISPSITPWATTLSFLVTFPFPFSLPSFQLKHHVEPRSRLFSHNRQAPRPPRPQTDLRRCCFLHLGALPLLQVSFLAAYLRVSPLATQSSNEGGRHPSASIQQRFLLSEAQTYTLIRHPGQFIAILVNLAGTRH